MFYLKKIFQHSVLVFLPCPFFLQATEELSYCEVLSTSFSGSTSVQVHCGEGPEGVGWISNSTPVRKVIMKLRDQETGRERMISLEPRAGREGDWYEIAAKNYILSKAGRGGIKGGSLPIGLYIPGGCGSSKISQALHNLTFNFFKDDNDTEFFKEDEECSWLNENDTNWREGVRDIEENEEVVFVRYALPPSTKVYYDNYEDVHLHDPRLKNNKSNRKFKGEISTFNVQTKYSDLHCEGLGDTFVLNSKNVGRKCTHVQMCFGEEAWCSAPNNREHFKFLNYGCKALEDGFCPSPTDCIFGENSFYASYDYAKFMESQGGNSFDLNRFYDFEDAGPSSSSPSKGVQ